MRSIEIRRFDPATIADFRAIRLAALKEAPQAFGSTYEVEATRPLAAFAERVDGSTVLGAYAGQDVVGMAGFRREDGAKHGHKGFVWGMYVKPHVRGDGVGTLLVEALLLAAAGVVEQLTLTVVSENHAAIALYRKFGFEVYGVEPRALKQPEGYSDEVLMVRFLATG